MWKAGEKFNINSHKQQMHLVSGRGTYFDIGSRIQSTYVIDLLDIILADQRCIRAFAGVDPRLAGYEAQTFGS